MGREGISRFAGKSELSDIEFLEIFKELLPYIKKGKIDLSKVKNIDMVEKMDSLFLHLGVNELGKFFIESSNSGEVTADNYVQKFGHMFFADHKASFESLIQNKILQDTLQKIYKKVGAIRYDAELFPLLTHSGDETGQVTFVATRYDRKKFGTNGAIVVFKASLKDANQQWKTPDPKINEKLVSFIESADSASWRIYTNEKHAKLSGNVEFNVENVDDMLSSPEQIDSAIQTISARGNTTIKKHLKTVIAELKVKLQDVLDKWADKTTSVLGKKDNFSPIEGVILRIKQANGDMFQVKGTSKAFDVLKQQAWATRMNLMDLESVTEGKFLKDALGLKTNQAAALNKAIKDASEAFSTDKTGEEAEGIFLAHLYKTLQEEGVSVNGAAVKQKALAIFTEAKNTLQAIVTKFKTENLDPDSKRKSQQALEMIMTNFIKIDEALKANIPDEAYPLYLLKFLLNRRLHAYAGKHMHSDAQDFSKFYEGQIPVILWNGRAQPWHVGHDAMIQVAKDKLQELGAQKILIMIVKGGKTSEDATQNPLTEEQQRQLIETIYAGDNTVEVSPIVLSSSNHVEIYNKMEKAGAYIVGWLAGEDRIETYRKDLMRFNGKMWVKDHAKLPVRVNERGIPDVEMIQTPRVMSGTQARESASTMGFEEWAQLVIPKDKQSDKKVIKAYKAVYMILNKRKKESVEFMVLSKFTDTINEQVMTEKPSKAQRKANTQAEIDAKQKERDAQSQAAKAKSNPAPTAPAPTTATTPSAPAAPTSPEVKPAAKPDITVIAKEISALDPQKILTPEDIDGVKEKLSTEEPAKEEPARRDMETPDDSEQMTTDSRKLNGNSIVEKYNCILRKKFKESILTELEASDIEKQKVIQSIVDYAKKNNHSKEDVLAALDMIKDSRAKANPEAATPEAATPEAEDTDEAPSASPFGSPNAMASILKFAGKEALSLVLWAMSKENAKAGEVINGIAGGIKSKIDKLKEEMKTGKMPSDQLNSELKRIFKDLKKSEDEINLTYKSLSDKAKKSGQDADKLIDASRKTRNISEIKKKLKDLNLTQELDKYKKTPIDPKFSVALQKAILNYNTLLADAVDVTSKTRTTSEKTLIAGIEKYLNGAGATAYPYLSTVVKDKTPEEVIRKSLKSINAKLATILQMPPDQVEKFKTDSARGEIDFYFTAEDALNQSLDSFSALYLSLKKKIDIAEIKAKTQLSAKTINNWIKHVKENPYDDKIIKEIGNQRAQ